MILLNQRLKQVRRALNMTQTEFARHLGITQNAYSMIENSVRPLLGKYIKLVAMTFNVNEHWLYTGEGEMFLSASNEKELLQIFQQLNVEKQHHLLHIAKELLNEQNNSDQ